MNDWVKKADVHSGQRPGTTTADALRIKELEREVKELRRANDILKTASAFFAQAELDRRLKSGRSTSTATVMTTGSSPSAGCCRWPRRVIGATQPDNATRNCAVNAPSVTRA